MVSASATELAIGFSTRTCFPASRAATAISACVSPGVQMSTTSTSSRSMTRRQSVSTASRPSWRAAAVARSSLRPESTAMCGSSGRSKNRWALRQAWEWARPMKAYPIIATPMRGLSSLIGIVLLTQWCASPGGVGRADAPGVSCLSGLERGVDVLVDVVRRHDGREQLDEPRDLDLDEVGHRLLLREEAGEADTVRGLGRRVDDGGLDEGVTGLDVAHGVGRAGAADDEELVTAGVLDRLHDADALVVVVVPDGVDVRGGLEQVRRDRLTALDGELGGDPVGDAQAALGQRVLEALAAVLGERQVVDTGDLGDDGVGVVAEALAHILTGAHAHAVVVPEHRDARRVRVGELAVDVDDRDTRRHRLEGDTG